MVQHASSARSSRQHRHIVEQIAAQQRNADYKGPLHHRRAADRHAYDPKALLHLCGGVLRPLSRASDTFSSQRRLCLKTSATFLSALRTNLCLHNHPPTTTTTTGLAPFFPLPMASSTSIDALPSSTPATIPDSQDDTDTAPPALSFTAATDPDDRTAALKLIADSIAQQRQTAGRLLLSHPLHVALFVAFCSVLGRWLFVLRGGQLGVVLSTVGGVTMACLVVVRWLVAPYIALAEGVHADLLDGKDVGVARYGDEIIGAVVWGWEGEGKKKRRRAEVRAWTVRLRYRGKGIGAGLLEWVVDEVRAKGGEGIGFEEGTVYSERVLWDFYNGTFQRREARAKRALQATWEARTGPKGGRKR